MKLFKSLVFASALFINSALAESEFIVDSTVTYNVGETGKTLVTHDITLENNFSTLYATSYSLTLENIGTAGVKALTADGSQLTAGTQKDGGKTTIEITFPDAVVGKGKQRHFFVTYENSNFAARTGEIWEISIPKLSDESSFRNYTAVLKVPDKFGLEAYISPKPEEASISDNYKNYRFNKASLIKTGVTAGFGNFQVFTYTLNYHLENPLIRSAETEIALPPDTAFQKIYIRSLIPEPEYIKIDHDGNWLATYKLSPRQRIDVTATGEVQIFASERHFPKPKEDSLTTNLSRTNYWQINDPEIKKLAAKFKTPRAIYDYVSTTLKYDYDRVKPNVERLGAVGALNNPNSAICMEFTDLFIAIARAAGIPAREINGYAYSENPDIQPLSLVADVLHSWPEYWDEKREAWIPIDPTWASTTGGVDFFDKLDLRHFTFVIHGEDPSKPYPPGSYKLGLNPQKDVFVSFGKLSPDTLGTPEIKAIYKQGLPLLASKMLITIKNPGPSALYSLTPEIYFDEVKHSSDFLEVLTPFAFYDMDVKIPYSFLGKNMPSRIKVVVEGNQIEVPTNKNKIILSTLLIIFTIFIIIIIVILFRLKWKNKLLRISQKVREFIYSKLRINQSTSVKP